MKKILALLMVFLSVSNANASNVKRYFQEAKFPNQALLNEQSVLDVDAAATTAVATVLAAVTTAAAASVTSGLTNPDVPRNIVIQPSGFTSQVGECTVTVTGTNIHGETITEDFSITAAQSSATTGAKAFKTIASIAFPAACESSSYQATWNVGVGEKIGFNRCMDYAGHHVFSTVGGVYESTRATVVADADEVEKNTADFNGTMDGSADFEMYFIQNYRCSP